MSCQRRAEDEHLLPCACSVDHCPPSTLATTRVHDQLSLAGATISSMSLPAPQEKSWATPDAHKLAKLLRQSRPEVCFVAFVPKVTKVSPRVFYMLGRFVLIVDQANDGFFLPLVHPECVLALHRRRQGTKIRTRSKEGESALA